MPLQILRFGGRILDQLYAPDGLRIGASGSSLREVRVGTVSIDPPSIGSGTSSTFTVTLSGAAVGDHVFLEPPQDLEGELVYQGATVTAANTVTVRLRNVGTSSVDGAARTWRFLLVKP